MQIDVMIPVAHKDMDMLTPAIDRLVKYSRQTIRRIYVVWQGPEKRGDPDQPAVPLRGPERPEVLFVHERTYPFRLDQIRAILRAMQSRDNHAGWYYQQLLKLYTFRAIPDVLPRLLIHDADVAFMAPVAFVDQQGRSLLSYGYPFRWLLNADTPAAYGSVQKIAHSHVEHAKRLIPGWQLANVFSGMQHHQLVERDIVEALLQEAEQAHGVPFWQAFIRQVDCSKWNSASEYVLYFHYALHNFPDRVRARHLCGIDVIHDADEPLRDSFEQIADGCQPDITGCHGFTSLKSRLETMDYIPPALRCQLIGEKRNRLAFRLKLCEGALDIDAW